MNKEFEEELRTIVNHPLRAYKSVSLGLMDMGDSNSECMIAALKSLAKSAGIMLKGAWLAVDSTGLLARCVLLACAHIIFLAFYPGIKIYYILRARNALRRDHPEYIARE